jgi:hypothetical protein
MDRRDFFKTIFATPLLTPLLSAFPSPTNEELFLISDSPHAYLPSLLGKRGSRNDDRERKYVFLGAHPQKTALSRALGAFGWTKAASLQNADLTLSFRPLQYPISPSFTLVREGRILDLRKNGLYALWKEMNENQPPSSCLTVASLQTRTPHLVPGTFARVFLNGRIIEEVSLKKNRLRTFQAARGPITIKIEHGKASIPASSCRNKICCSAFAVSSPGERIVCAPNHFLLEIGGPGSTDTIIG